MGPVTKAPQPAPGTGPSLGGFSVVPEPESFSCSEANLAPLSLPGEALSFVPTGNVLVHAYKNGDSERRIHCNTELTEKELEGLRELQRQAASQGLAFFPSVAIGATRYLSRARGDVQKALKMLQDTQAWRANYFKDGPLADKHIEEDMRLGIVYFCGRDYAMRPVIVVRGKRIPQEWYKEKRVDKLIRLLIFSLEYMMRYMTVPGRVENLSVIVDLKGLGISQVPIGGLSEVYKVLGHHYMGRVVRFYCVNVPTALNIIAGMAKNLLTDRQRQKLQILDDVSKLRQEFAPHQLEVDLGGSRPPITEFFPFPLLAGPFQVNCDQGPDPNAVRNAHQALTAAGARGRLWDSSRTREQNCGLELGPRAPAIFEQCGLPPPPAPQLPAHGQEAEAEAGGEEDDTFSKPALAPWKADASTDAGTARATDEPGSLRSGDEAFSPSYERPDVQEEPAVEASQRTGGLRCLFCSCG